MYLKKFINHLGNCISKNETSCPVKCPEICGPKTTIDCDLGYDENGCWLGNECKSGSQCQGPERQTEICNDQDCTG